MSASKISNIGQNICGDPNFLKWSFLDFHRPTVLTQSCLLLGRTQCLVRGHIISQELLEIVQLPLTFSVSILESKEWHLSISLFGRDGLVDYVNLYSAFAWHSAQEGIYLHKVRLFAFLCVLGHILDLHTGCSEGQPEVSNYPPSHIVQKNSAPDWRLLNLLQFLQGSRRKASFFLQSLGFISDQKFPSEKLKDPKRKDTFKTSAFLSFLFGKKGNVQLWQ